jgi:ribosomal protein RSM22 (predicted rRNA methylase)
MKKLFLSKDYLSALESYFDIPLINPIPKKLTPYAQTIGRISDGLKKSKQRPDFIASSYLNEKNFCDAYLLYYTTSNLLKIHHPLNELERSDFFEKKNLRVLDLGSGTGTVILGTSFWFHEKFPLNEIHFTAWDRSDLALKTFEKFYQRFDWRYPQKTFRKDVESSAFDGAFYDLITGGNILNELTAAGEERLIGILEKNLLPEGYVILVEPALKDSSRRLLQFRDRMLKQGWFVYAPCFTQNPCPALVHEDDWCHHDLDWERPGFIAVIDEMIGHIRKSLKFTYLILSRQDVHLSNFIFPQRNFREQFRVVSDVFKEKGRRRVFLCNDLGRCECLKNNRDHSSANKVFDDLQRYDVVEISGLSVRKDLKRIGKETSVRSYES